MNPSMTPQARLSAPRTAPPMLALASLLLAAAATWPVQAAGVPAAAAAAPAPGLQPGRSYVVMPGDTLDKVVQKTMASSPLKNEVLREALVSVNAQAIPAGRNPRLVPGTVLQLPDQDAVLRTVFGPPPGAAAASPAEPAGPGAGETRRRWVRYP